MSAAYDIAVLLQAAGLGAVGADVGVNAFMDNSDNETGVFEFSGLPDIVTHGGTTAFETPKIQIQVRNTSNKESFRRCYQIYRFLSGMRDRTINGHLYTYIQPSVFPHLLNRDPITNRVIHMAEFQTQRTPEAEVVIPVVGSVLP